jgi:hypothetical protein
VDRNAGAIGRPGEWAFDSGRCHHFTIRGRPTGLPASAMFPSRSPGVCVTPALPHSSTVMVCWPSETEELPCVVRPTQRLPSLESPHITYA